jgi:prepilin-type N-terminal cleavage/methylation domain-containing protein
MFCIFQPLSRDDGPRPRRGQRSAFTFPEVLAVVVILSIATAIVLPQVTSHDDLTTAAAARTVMADLLYAQNRAIATQTMHYITFDTSGQQYTLYSSMAPATVLQHPVYLDPYVMTFGQTGPNNVSSSVTLGSVSFNGQNTIAFDETGVPYSYGSGTATLLSSAGTITLNCGTYSLTISVAKDTGEITTN